MRESVPVGDAKYPHRREFNFVRTYTRYVRPRYSLFPFLFVRQTASRIRGILEGRERAKKKKRGAVRRGFTRSTWNTKQNYRLRAQHHHKSQVYGYVGRIRA